MTFALHLRYKFRHAVQSVTFDIVAALFVDNKWANCTPNILDVCRKLRYSVVVSTPDFESGNPGSNPGIANTFVFWAGIQLYKCLAAAIYFRACVDSQLYTELLNCRTGLT